MPQSYTEMPKVINRIFMAGYEAMLITVSNVKERMSEEGKPIKYPVQWDSEKQRRAFFATNGFGKGIPYKRTHQYRLGWKMESQPFGRGARVTLSNKHPAGAVGGMASGWQSKIHRNRWPYLLTVLFDELRKLPDEISNRLKVIAE